MQKNEDELSDYLTQDEIEVIKSEGYREIYNDKGIIQEDIIYEQDINDKSGNFTGYHKKVIIKDIGDIPPEEILNILRCRILICKPEDISNG